MADMTWLDNLIAQNTHNTPYDKQVSPVVTPANPSGVGTGGTTAPHAGGIDANAMAQIFSALAQHLGAQDQQAGARIQQGNDVLLGRHLGTDGQPVPTGSPFGGPLTFKSAPERYNEMATHTGAYAPTGFGIGAATYPAETPEQGANRVDRFVADTASEDRGLIQPPAITQPARATTPALTPLQSYMQRPFQSDGKSYPFSSAPKRTAKAKNRYSIL